MGNKLTLNVNFLTVESFTTIMSSFVPGTVHAFSGIQSLIAYDEDDEYMRTENNCPPGCLFNMQGAGPLGDGTDDQATDEPARGQVPVTLPAKTLGNVQGGQPPSTNPLGNIPVPPQKK